MTVNYLPTGYHNVTPFLIVNGAQKLLDFIKTVFDGTMVKNTAAPDGKVIHAEIKIGDSIIMITDASAQHPAETAHLYLYVKDTDSAYNRALGAGAASVMKPTTQFYGDRNAAIKDSFGFTWWLATHVEDVSHDEILRRMKEQSKK